VLILLLQVQCWSLISFLGKCKFLIYSDRTGDELLFWAR
jgi:hypothetical protein